MKKNDHENDFQPGTDKQAEQSPQQDRREQDVRQDQQPGAESTATVGDIEALKAERDDLLEKLKRVSADYLNYQKRVSKEISQVRQFANADLIKNLLTVLDDIERALDHAADDPLSKGMKMVYDKALDILSRYGLKQIEALGKPFDPEKHEAMTTEPVDSYDEPIVLKELQKGYEFQGRVLRPARVVISAPSKQNERHQQADKEQTEQSETEEQPRHPRQERSSEDE